MKNNKRKTGIARLLELSGRRKTLLMASSAMVTVHAVLAMAPYALIYYILKELQDGGLTDQGLTAYIAWTFAALIISAFMLFASGLASHIAAFNILYELRCKISEKLGRLPMGYMQERSSGALKKILADDVERIEKFIAHSLPDTVRAMVLPVIILSYLFLVDWRLAVVSLIPLLLLLIIVPVLSGSEKHKDRIRKYHQALEEMNSSIVEFVRAMPVMKIFGQTASAFTKYSGTVHGFGHHLKRWNSMTAPLWGIIMSFLTNALLPLLIAGVLLYFRQKVDLSAFLLFLVLGVGYIRPVFKLASVSSELSMISRGVDRIDEILFETKEQKDGHARFPDATTLEIKDLCFSYTGDMKVLQNVGFTVRQGTITALVGPSGSGKSTLGQLIARFYEPQSGSIILGGININELRMEELMANTGFVFQDNMMFRQSLYENIRMGMDRSEAQITAAAKTAQCHDFIMALPDGYQTRFGDKGVHLSGGEQQRIQLARVILKDPSVLVLDEATAFSDPENEHLIMTAINELIRNKTVIVIAHRLATITRADQIVVLKNGRVADMGTHAQLLDSCGLYTKMWNAHKRAKEFEIQI